MTLAMFPKRWYVALAAAALAVVALPLSGILATWHFVADAVEEDAYHQSLVSQAQPDIDDVLKPLAGRSDFFPLDVIDALAEPEIQRASAINQYASREDALGHINILLWGDAAEGAAVILRERAITEHLNVVSTIASASRLLDRRNTRPSDIFIPSVLVVFNPTDEVQRIAARGQRLGLTVVLAVESLNSVIDWDRRNWQVFRPKAQEVAV